MSNKKHRGRPTLDRSPRRRTAAATTRSGSSSPVTPTVCVAAIISVPPSFSRRFPDQFSRFLPHRTPKAAVLRRVPPTNDDDDDGVLHAGRESVCVGGGARRIEGEGETASSVVWMRITHSTGGAITLKTLQAFRSGASGRRTQCPPSPSPSSRAMPDLCICPAEPSARPAASPSSAPGPPANPR